MIKFFILFFVASVPPFSGAGELGGLWKSINDQRRENEVCAGKFFVEDWDQCYKIGAKYYGGDFRTDNIISANQMFETDSLTFRDRPCMCDRDCVEYGDCCIDVVQNLTRDGERLGVEGKWKCSRLIGAKTDFYDYIYTIAKCSPDWPDDENLIRNKCEFDHHSSLDYLQYIPVLNRTTGVTYRNVYCATCNYDTSLAKWNIDTICLGNITGYHDKIGSDYLVEKNFIPEKVEWEFELNNQTIICHLSIQQFRGLNATKYVKNYGSRLCLPAHVESCSPDWPDHDDRARCKMYTSKLFFPASRGFKNYFCAKCNGVSEKNMSCYFASSIGRKIPKQSLSFSVLFDFSTSSESSTRCQPGMLYDPIRKHCTALGCARLYKLLDGKCVRDSNLKTTNDSLLSDCHTISLTNSEFVLLANQSAWVNHSSRTYQTGEYELTKEENGSISGMTVCIERSPWFNFSAGQTILSNVCLYISILCLFVHIMFYLIVPKLRNLPGKNLLCLSLSLLLGQMLFLFGVGRYEDRSLCFGLATVIHFFFLSYFFWTNVMAFDICRTFRSDSYRQSSGKKTFVKYSCYAWLTSLTIVLIAIIVDNVNLSDPEFRPGYGKGICWISGKKALITFFIVPLAAVMIGNVVMFSLTAWHIRQSDKVSSRAIKRSNTIRYLLYIKLSLIMGLTWALAFVAMLANTEILWYFFIVFNGLQGALIFLAFSCKKKVFLLVRNVILKKSAILTSTSFTTRKLSQTTMTTSNHKSSTRSNSKDTKDTDTSLASEEKSSAKADVQL